MNGDLISRSALLEELYKGTIIPDDMYSEGIMAGNDYAVKKIETAPAVDAVEVVGCRDCVHYEFGFCVKSILYSKGPDGYCESGEWRADG